MRVHVFENAIEPDPYGFSSDRDGNNLPPERGQWKYFKTIDMAVGKTPRWGVSREKGLEEIEKDGFFLTTREICLEEKEGGCPEAPRGINREIFAFRPSWTKRALQPK